MDTIERKTTEWEPDTSRTIRINYSGTESDKVKSYHVRVAKTAITPEPTATGNEKVTIIKHSLPRIIDDGTGGGSSNSVDLAIRNVSHSTIASAVFEAVFYDIEGNVLDTVKHKEIDLKPNTSRAIYIACPRPEVVRSYDIRVTRTTTANVEKVQLRRHGIRTTEAGDEEVRGIVKNISEVKTDAAVVATFYDPKKENIGTKVLVLRDIEPNSIKQFHFIFKPQEGYRVRTFTLNIGEIAE